MEEWRGVVTVVVMAEGCSCFHLTIFIGGIGTLPGTGAGSDTGRIFFSAAAAVPPPGKNEDSHFPVALPAFPPQNDA